MQFNNATYNMLKNFAQYVLPALGTLYFALAGIWGLPYGEQIVGTITAIDTFLGVLLGISSASYSGDGTMYINLNDPNKDVYRMELNDDLSTLNDKNEVIFKVKQTDTSLDYPA